MSAGARTAVADLTALNAWVQGSRQGAQAIYAENDMNVLPRNAVTARARALYDEGLVTLTSAREPGRFMWIVERLARTSTPARPRVRREEVETPEDLVLRLLRRAANLGRACPTNDEISRACSLDDAAQASYIVRKLRDAKSIDVVQGGIGERRIVTIVGSGRRTAAGFLS